MIKNWSNAKVRSEALGGRIGLPAFDNDQWHSRQGLGVSEASLIDADPEAELFRRPPGRRARNGSPRPRPVSQRLRRRGAAGAVWARRTNHRDGLPRPLASDQP